MWLEAVNPHRPVEVCVAQITQVRGRLLWLRLEGTEMRVCVFKYQWIPAVFQSACVSEPCILFVYMSVGVTAPSPPSSLLSTCLQVCQSPCQSASWMSSPWTSSPSAGVKPTLTPWPLPSSLSVCTHTHVHTHRYLSERDSWMQTGLFCLVYRPEAEEDCGGPARETVRDGVWLICFIIEALGFTNTNIVGHTHPMIMRQRTGLGTFF